MESEIRDYNNFNWEMIDNEYKGVPLKHAFDMICSVNDIQHEKECPTQSQPSYFKEFVTKGSNQIDKCSPKEGIAMPEHWFDWSRAITLDEFKQVPLKL